MCEIGKIKEITFEKSPRILEIKKRVPIPNFVEKKEPVLVPVRIIRQSKGVADGRHDI